MQWIKAVERDGTTAQIGPEVFRSGYPFPISAISAPVTGADVRF
jgi:hypothetical protein